jgi:hypothetical protein
MSEKKEPKEVVADIVAPKNPEKAKAHAENLKAAATEKTVLKAAPAPKQATLNDYIGAKARVKVEGATSQDCLLAGADAFCLGVRDLDNRLKFYPWTQVKEIFPNQ